MVGFSIINNQQLTVKDFTINQCHSFHRCKKRQIWQMCAIFSKAIQFFGPCMQTGTGTVSTVLFGLCLLGLRQLYSADRRVLLTLYQNIDSSSTNELQVLVVHKIAFNTTVGFATVSRPCSILLLFVVLSKRNKTITKKICKTFFSPMAT